MGTESQRRSYRFTTSSNAIPQLFVSCARKIRGRCGTSMKGNRQWKSPFPLTVTYHGCLETPTETHSRAQPRSRGVEGGPPLTLFIHSLRNICHPRTVRRDQSGIEGLD